MKTARPSPESRVVFVYINLNDRQRQFQKPHLRLPHTRLQTKLQRNKRHVPTHD